jgi:cellulose synthase (UDP-forming)
MFLDKGPFGRGLTLSQRFFFATIGFDWAIQCLIRIMVMLIPLLAIFCGLKPYGSVSTETFVYYLLPVWLSLKGVCFCLAPGRHFPIITTATWLLICMRIVPTVIATLIRPFGAPFRVTPKGSAISNRSDSAVLWTALFLIAVFVAALFLNRFPQFHPTDSGLAGIAGLFCMYNIVLLLLVFFMALELPRRPVEEWFDTAENCRLIVGGETFPATLTGVCLTGAVLQLDQRVPRDLPVCLDLRGVGRLHVVPTRRGRRKMVVEFQGMEPEMHDRLVQKIFGGSYDNTIRRGNPIGIMYRLSVRFLTGICLRSGRGWEMSRSDGERRIEECPTAAPEAGIPRPPMIEMPTSRADADVLATGS